MIAGLAQAANHKPETQESLFWVVISEGPQGAAKNLTVEERPFSLRKNYSFAPAGAQPFPAHYPGLAPGAAIRRRFAAEIERHIPQWFANSSSHADSLAGAVAYRMRIHFFRSLFSLGESAFGFDLQSERRRYDAG
ncbi:MAG: hypothetical protein ACRD2U_08320 [Terriglobales bacterium]